METRTENLPPTWSGMMPVYLEWIENGNDQQRATARKELTWLAAGADQLIAEARKKLVTTADHRIEEASK